MSQVQNPILHNIVQPILFLGTGLLAGRFVQHFPSASKGGLLLSAGLGTAITLVSQKWAPYNERSKHAFLRVVASLAIGNILTSLAAKALKGRVEMSFSAASYFFVVETCVATGITTFSHNIAEIVFLPEEIQAMHNQIKDNPLALRELDMNKLISFIRGCFDHNLPPIFLRTNQVDIPSNILLNRDFPNLTDNQLLWHIEVYCGVGPRRYYYGSEELALLFEELHSRGLSIKGNFSFDLNLLRARSHNIELLEAYFRTNPVTFHLLLQPDQNIGIDYPNVEHLFANIPRPSVIKYIEHASANQLKQFTLEDWMLMKSFIPELEASLPSEKWTEVKDIMKECYDARPPIVPLGRVQIVRNRERNP